MTYLKLKLQLLHRVFSVLIFPIIFHSTGWSQGFEVQSGNHVSFHLTNLKGLHIEVNFVTSYLLRHFELDKQHKFELGIKLESDENQIHQRYSHYFNGARVLGSDVVCHFEDSVLYSINGQIRIPEPSAARIELSVAREAAMLASKAESFKWDFPEEEAMLKIWKDDTSATYFPFGELVYAPQDLDFQTDLQLCYVFEINSETPLMRKNIFIHAVSGVLVAEEDLLHLTDVKGSANTKYRGVKDITTDSTAPSAYRLRETTRGGGIETYDMNKGTSYAAAVDFTDTDNYWNNYNSNFDEAAGDAHFGAEMTYDYFKKYFNRNSYNGTGAKIRSYIHYRSNYINAFWNGSVMTYGDGNGTSYTPLTSVDICGHEVTHAVTTNSANLVYSYESGALNESFSDIFGNAIEYFADSTQFSWRMGEDIMASKSGLRNMANPKTHADPSMYKGTYWYTGIGDNGGVHTNSGVQNFWFYVLTTGASGTNDKGDKYKVDSLGIHKAQQIAYRNLTVYLTSASNYADARYYAIQSATDLYGDCSKEVQATTNAWYAVGVGDAYDSSKVVAQFTADSTYCDASESVQFVNKSINAKTYLWDFGDGKTSTKLNPTHVYPSQGTYSVQLIAESCFNSNYDTIKKANFIRIDSNQDICNGYLLPKGTWSTVHACNGFIYDHNGESDYDGLLRDTLTVDFGKSDSAQITFLELDYEDKYDSIYVYDGFNTSGTYLGGYTGKTLPFGGKTKTIYSGAVTIRHFSDPYVVGTGFKVKFVSFKEPLQLFKPGNRTVCYNETVTLTALGRGGDVADHAYFWNGIKGSKTISFVATTDTLIYLTFGDECMKEYIYDSIRITVTPIIQFSQSNDTTICQGTSGALSVNPNGGKSTYSFKVSDGATGSGNNFTYNTPPLSPGIHPYWIQFTDGCTTPDDTAFFMITVRDSLALTINKDTTICYGTNVTISTTASGGISSQYRYDWGGGPTSNPSSNVSPLSNTSYTVRLSDGCSNYNPSASVQVNVLDSLSVSIQAQDTACYGETVELTSTVTGGIAADYKYLWKPNLSTNTNEFVTIRSTSNIELEVTDGCTPKNGLANRQIIGRPALSLSLPPDQAICPGESININAIPSGGVIGNHNVTWNHGLGTGTSHTVTPVQTTVYEAVLWDGCSESVTKNVTITVNPKPKIDFVVDKNPNCTGIAVQFTNFSSQSANDQYTWNFGDNKSSTDRSPNHVYSVAGKYDVKLFVQNIFGCVDSVNMLGFMEIVNHPVADFSFSPLDPSFLRSRVDFTNKSSFFTTSLWDFGDGQTSLSTDPFNIYKDSGSYTVTLMIENAIGCFDQTTKTLYVKDDVVLYIPTAMSPNHDEINDLFNPITRGIKSYDIMIYNRWGEVLWNSSLSEKGWNGDANGSRVPLGFYFYRITGIDMNGNEVEENGRFNVVY